MALLEFDFLPPATLNLNLKQWIIKWIIKGNEIYKV